MPFHHDVISTDHHGMPNMITISDHLPHLMAAISNIVIDILVISEVIFKNIKHDNFHFQAPL